MLIICNPYSFYKKNLYKKRNIKLFIRQGFTESSVEKQASKSISTINTFKLIQPDDRVKYWMHHLNIGLEIHHYKLFSLQLPVTKVT